MTVMLGFVLIYLSAAWLPCVSAGGAYCAKTARARAAALGLKFPRGHGAPDLSGPPPYSALHPRAPQHHQLFQNNPQPPAADYNMLSNLPKGFPHFQPAGYGSPVQTNPLSGLSGGEPFNNRQSNLAQVKRVVGPLMQTRPPGQSDFEDGASESHRNKLQFAYHSRDPIVGATVLNRHGMSGLSGRSRPLSPGYGFYYMPYAVGAGSKPGVVYTALGPRGSHPRGLSAWPIYGRVKNKPRNPFYNLGKSSL